ncbi:MAG: DUF3313 family protein [Nitrospirales bacterium]|nr:DUF3313 family protein [Nitrospirales bacterium]
MLNNRLIFQSLIALVLVSIVAGCAPTRQARSVEKTGFLGDYSMLREGERGEALMIYRNSGTDWASYHKVILNPVTVWLGKDSHMEYVSAIDRQRLADDLWSKLLAVLEQDYQIVHKAGPGVMRVQVAITEAEESTMGLDTVSSIVPQMRALSEIKYLATGTAGFVGKASAEAKVTDAQSGDLLLAAVDRRAGSKSIGGSLNTWNDVEETYQHWAYQTRYRLCKLRGESNCIKPEDVKENE